MPHRSWKRPFARREVAPHQHPQLRRRIRRLEQTNESLRARVEVLEQANELVVARVTDLEDGLQQERRLHLRVAELTDLVTTLIAAAVQGDEEFRRVLDASAATSTQA